MEKKTAAEGDQGMSGGYAILQNIRKASTPIYLELPAVWL
jgi:hypothetical protein